MNRFCDLIVVYTHRPHQGKQRGQTVVIVVSRLVDLHDFKVSVENPGENEFRFVRYARFVEHVQKFCVLGFVQPERVAVGFRVFRTAAAAFVFSHG